MKKLPLLFWLGLGIKIVCLFFFGSSYLKNLFIPFLDWAVTHPGQNPWAQFEPHFFPYGSVLFLLLATPKFLAYSLFGPYMLGAGAFGLASIKLPLLLLDLLLLFTLRRLNEGRIKEPLIYYWLNPILFYITYVHVQLDLVAMTFCFLSLNALVKKNYPLSAVAFAAATLSKFHVVLLLPLIAVYEWRRCFQKRALQNLCIFVCIWAGLSVLGFLPLISSGNISYVSTSSPEAGRIFAAQLPFGANVYLYLGLSIVLFALGRICLSSKISDRGLFDSAGVLFGCLIMATLPMPGWYFWVVPFIALSYSLYSHLPKSLFIGLCIIYLLYFLGVETWKNPLGLNITFTLLQTSMAGILLALGSLVLRFEAPLLRRTGPLLIGIAGDSGAGKNHLTDLLKNFDPKSTQVLEGDDYHRWERGDISWDRYTHLNPKANHLISMAFHTEQLLRGLSVEHHRYDHQIGRFSPGEELRASRTLIVQGLHTLYLRSFRGAFDLKVFVDTDPSLKLFWKAERDHAERGASIEKILSTIENRQEDRELHIEPQKPYADWILQYRTREVLNLEDIQRKKKPALYAKHLLWNDVPIQRIFDLLRKTSDLKAELDLVPSDPDRIALTIEGSPQLSSIHRIASEAFDDLPGITRAPRPPVLVDGLDGTTQLIALLLLSHQSQRRAL